MFKKISTILIVLILASTSVFATSLFQLGGSVELPLPITTLEEMGNQFKSLENYRFGADVRFTVPTGGFLGFQIGARSMMSISNDPLAFNLNTDGTLNLVFFNDKRLNFSVGTGVNMLISSGDPWTFNGNTNFIDGLMYSPFIYTAAINFKFGFGLSVLYTVPTLASAGNFTWGGLAPQFEQGRVGASLLINLF